MIKTGKPFGISIYIYNPRDGLGRDLRDQTGARWGANLVGNDAKIGAVFSQSQYGRRKIIVSQRIDPAYPENEMVASGVQDRLIARELGRAIDAQRLRVIGFNIRLRL